MLRVSQLGITFDTFRGRCVAVRGVSFEIERASTLCLVGESGCGKSVTALSLLRLLPKKAELTGVIEFEGKDMRSFSSSQWQSVRGNLIGMIFQEPMTSLNPVMTISAQIEESLEAHQSTLSGPERSARIDGILTKVGIPVSRQYSYPHEMSGGMRQRAMIAMALACGPKLLIADEPTTALDVTIQAQILSLLRKLKTEMGMSLLLITHDLGVVSEMADDVIVMYAGQVVERARRDELFSNALHPYTQGLFGCVPEDGKLVGIPGTVPSIFSLPRGCAFQQRCPRVTHHCRNEDPVLEKKSDRHWVRCWEVPS